MSLTLEPLSDATDPWVLAIERLETKIKNPDLSFYKHSVTAFGRGPKVFALAAPGPDAMVYDPSPDDCPAVVIETSNPGAVEDRGAGAERWPFSLNVFWKGYAADGNKKKLLRNFHELLRTVFCGWRQGQLDPLSTILGAAGGYTLLPSDLTPEIARPSVGMMVGRGAFGVRFVFAESILG